MKPIDELLNELTNLWTECNGEAVEAKSANHYDLTGASIWDFAAQEIARAIRRIELVSNAAAR